jgi:hypothetical protein
MKKRRYILVLMWMLSLFVGSCDTDRNIDPPDESHFAKYYGSDENEKGVDLVVLQDGTSILLGSASGDHQIYLVKVDQVGNIIWEKYLGTAFDVVKDIEPTLDGNFVILSDYQDPANNIEVKVIKINPDGEKIDSVVHGSPGIENAKSITPLSDGGFILTGSTEFTSNIPKPGASEDLSDIFHFRCDENLDFNLPLWEDQYGSGTLDVGTKVFEKSPTEFYVFGYSNQDHGENNAGKTNLLYYLIGAGGVINAAPYYFGEFDQNTTSSNVISVPSSIGGGYFVLGTKFDATGTGSRIHASKLRSPLSFSFVDELLDENIPLGTGDQLFQSVAATASQFGGETGFLLLANENRGNNHINISLSKINQVGNVSWYVSLGSEDKDDRAAAVAELPDGRIFVLGTVGIGDQTKMALFKLNSAGQLIK